MQKEQKKKKIWGNRDHNILRLFGILPIFLLTQVKWSVIICNKNCIYELPNELPSDFRDFGS